MMRIYSSNSRNNNVSVESKSEDEIATICTEMEEDSTIKSLKRYERSKEMARKNDPPSFPPLDSRSGWLEGLGSNGSFVSGIFSGCGRRFNEDVLRAVFRRNCFFVAPRTWQRPCPKVRIRIPPVGMEFTFDVNKKEKEIVSIPSNDSRVFISAGFCGPSRIGPVRRFTSKIKFLAFVDPMYGIDRGDVESRNSNSKVATLEKYIYIRRGIVRNHGRCRIASGAIDRRAIRVDGTISFLICKNRAAVKDRANNGYAWNLLGRRSESDLSLRSSRNARETRDSGGGRSIDLT